MHTGYVVFQIYPSDTSGVSPNLRLVHTAPGGDFNYINDHTLDRKGGNLIVKKQYKHIGTCIGDILAECHLKGIWRTKNPNKKSYTWSTRDKSI